MSSASLLSITDISKRFQIRTGIFSKALGYVQAVDGVTLEVQRGETLGLVGESGCGKSTLARIILKTIECDSGRIIFDGVDVTHVSGKRLKEFRSSVQIVFQDTQASLDPRLTAEQSAMEPLRIQKKLAPAEMKERIAKLFGMVGLDESHMRRYPHELSGGQRQRVVIARALALQPRLIVLDEPTSSLDVSVQAQILNLLKDLQRKLGLTYIFISHNLSVVGFMCSRAAVMYLGKIVELAEIDQLLNDPLHPYSQALLAASPVTDSDVKPVYRSLKGDLPSPLHLPAGCRFHTRCPFVMDICKQEDPELLEVKQEHMARCFLYPKTS